MLTIDRLRDVLDYNPDTGVFTWRMFMSSRAAKGSRAGTVNNSKGYREVRIDKKTHYEHRLAWFHVHGEWPANEIDHINHDRTDNRIENLRDVTRVENMKNVSLLPRNTSGHAGVSWSRDRSAWRVSINKVKYGNFKCKATACYVAKWHRNNLGYHANHGK